jgi:hypothetical protein
MGDVKNMKIISLTPNRPKSLNYEEEKTMLSAALRMHGLITEG